MNGRTDKAKQHRSSAGAEPHAPFAARHAGSFRRQQSGSGAATLGSCLCRRRAVWRRARVAGGAARRRRARGAAGTMMPGETQPPPAGTAAAVPCKNCAVLQQVAVAASCRSARAGFLSGLSGPGRCGVRNAAFRVPPPGATWARTVNVACGVWAGSSRAEPYVREMRRLVEKCLPSVQLNRGLARDRWVCSIPLRLLRCSGRKVLAFARTLRDITLGTSFVCPLNESS